MQQQTNTSKIDIKNFDKAELGRELAVLGIIIDSPKTDYELSRYKSDRATVVVYTSGKVVVQTKGEELAGQILNILSGDSENSIGDDWLPHIGSDEVGKGDYFGPLVVCSAFLDEKGLQLAKEYGVVDSKKMNDERMLEIYEEVSEKIPHAYTVTKPQEYNEIYAKVKNASVLLGMQHGEAIENLLAKLKNANVEPNKVVIDQFSSRMDRINDNLGTLGKQTEIIQFPKGEQDPAVAVASVFARAIFLKEWYKMELEFGMKFPKGATEVLPAARNFVRNLGRERLGEVAKISFRTTDQI